MNRRSGTSSQQDYAFVSELLDMIDQDPANIQPRWILVQLYETYGWLDEAADLAQEILALSPGDEDAEAWLIAYVHAKTPRTRAASPPIAVHSLQHEDTEQTYESSQVSGGLKELELGYMGLMDNAQELLEELHVLQEMCAELDITGQIADLKAMTEGRFSAVVKVKPPAAATSVSQNIKSAGENAIEVAFADLEANARWLRTQTNNSLDQTRDKLQKRAVAIKTGLPRSFGHDVDIAFMHVEHEILNKTYQNGDTYTMLGDLISAIPRSKFFVSEDGYAWNMEELADAIEANRGVMRNPLSGEMFTTDDVRAIIQHPLGKRLAALQVKQQQLTRGIRKETVDRLGNLAGVLLADQDDSSAVSRAALDEFMAYSATLPQAEQDALHNLRVPARDSHTGQAFDSSIGDSIADAKANRLCFHKAGDLLQQATSYLRSKKSR